MPFIIYYRNKLCQQTYLSFSNVGKTRSNIVWTKLKDYATGLSFVLSYPSASRRFFMLNGVETKSPSGNIVVVKSGTKVRKMVVR